MGDDDPDIVPEDRPSDLVLDAGAVLANLMPALDNAVPGLGFALGTVLGGWVNERRRQRIVEVLDKVRWDLEEAKATIRDVQREYVRSEDFEELLARTLRQAADERDEQKRTIYGRFLAGTIASPGEPYDEQVRFLQTLERLQPDHIRVLKAIMAAPDPNTNLYMGSPRQVLEKRLPDMSADRIEESVLQLNDLRLTRLENFRTTMTGHGAENTRTAITPFGQRFTRFLVD
jgi:hypothetical protein